MSTGEVTKTSSAIDVISGQKNVSSFLLMISRISPQQGWDTYLLLVALISTVSWSVIEANWVSTPGLIPLVFMSTVTGLLLAKAKWPSALLHLIGITIGFVVVIVLSSSLVAGVPPIEPVKELGNRLNTWYAEATSGGISQDVIPFTVALLSINWLLGYFSAWFLFRNSNVWVALILCGIAILTNLSFLPDIYGSRFLVFMFLAMLLMIRVSMFQRHTQLIKANIGVSSMKRWPTVIVAGAISAVLLVMASFLPLNVYVWSTAVDVWNLGRTPISGLEDEFTRLFSGIESRKDLSGRYFGKFLPFQRGISTKPNVVMWTTSEPPTYWLTRTYSEYTSNGWIVGDTEEIEVGPTYGKSPTQESANRDLVIQSLKVATDTSRLVAGGQIDIINRNAVLEILEPLDFEIDLDNPRSDATLPNSVRRLAVKLRGTRSTNPSIFGVSAVVAMLPHDLILTDPEPSGASSVQSPVDKITVQRKSGTMVDVVSLQFADTLRANESYTIGTYISKATDSDLRSAGSDYSGFIKDHYLQLPPELPQRVRDTAIELTKGAHTPLEKALVIQNYLRGNSFTYSKKADKLPIDQDAVDFFLFNTKSGYSDFFASAMAVMLRSVGIPSRLATGYGPGKSDNETGSRIVMSSDSHGWTQVYFPGHGWIDFEPTPRWPTPQLAASKQDISVGGIEQEPGETFIPEVPIECYFPENFTSVLHYQDFCGGEFDIDSTDSDQPITSSGNNLINLVIPTMLIVISVIAIFGFLTWLVWTRDLSKAHPEEKAYTRMIRLGALAGVQRLNHQTPLEYATRVGSTVPSVMTGARIIAHAFAVSRYGGRDHAQEHSEEVNVAWRTVMSGLLSKALSRLVHLGHI